MSGTEVERLLSGLESPDEAVRLDALRLLAVTPGAPVLRSLRRSALSDASPAVRAEALRLLGEAADRLSGADLGPALGSARCEVLLNDPDASVRAQAVASLTVSFDARVPEILSGALDRETDPLVLTALIQALSPGDAPGLATRLGTYLAHADARVRAAAVEALAETRDESQLAHLVPLLEDRHETVRVAAVRALRRARQEAVLACVENMLTRSEERDVRAALYVLRYFASAVSAPRLAARLTDPSPSVVAMARASLSSLARKGSKRARRALDQARAAAPGGSASAAEKLAAKAPQERLEALSEILQAGMADQLPRVRAAMEREVDPRVLGAMVTAVGRMGGKGDMALLAPYLDHKRSRVRAAAVRAVHALDRTAVSILLPALRDRSSRVRAQAIVVLAGAKGVNVMGSLKQMASSKDPRVLISAVWCAAKIKDRVDGAKPLLEKLATSPDADVAGEARQALGRAGEDASSPSVDVTRIPGAEPVLDESDTFDGRPPPVDDTTVLIEPALPAPPSVPRASAWTVKPAAPLEAPEPPASPAEPPIFAVPDADASSAGADASYAAADASSIAAPAPVAAPPPVAPPTRASARTTGAKPALPTGERAASPSGRRPAPTRVDAENAPGADPETARPRRPPVAAIAGGAAAVVVAVLAFVFWPAPPAPPPPPPPPSVAVASAPPSAPPTPPPVPEVRYSFAPVAPAPAGLVAPPAMTLEEVEASIKLGHAHRGITSKAIIHLMALDFVHTGYRAAIAKAREAALENRTDEAFETLEQALNALAPDHLTGRIAVLRALVTVAREAEQFDRAARYRTQLGVEQQKLIEIATEAARDGGLRDHELAKLLARLKEAEKHKAEATRGADWLSGASLFEEKNAPQNGSSGG